MKLTKTKFILLYLFFFSISELQAQNMYVQPTVGNLTNYQIANIKKITFNNGNLLVTPTTTSQPINSHSLSSNRFICFKDYSTLVAPPIAYDQIFCNMSVTIANLIAIGTNIKWYTSPSGGIPLTGTTVLTTGTYYATQTVNNFESARNSIFVTTSVPAPSAASSESFCAWYNPTIADFNVVGTITMGTNIKWYSTSSGGTVLSTSTILLNGVTYYASQSINGCESIIRKAVTVHITDAETAPPIVANQTVCSGALISDLSATGTNIKWYDPNGNALASSQVLTTGVYHATQTINTCESSSVAVSVNVNVTPPPTATAQTLSSASTVANLTATGTNIKWYSSSSGGTALSAASALVTGTYYVTQTINNCESIRTAVIVTVTTLNITEQELKSFCVYPNPVNNVLKLSGTTEDQLVNLIQIISLEGQLILQQKQNNNNGLEINVSSLTRGLYLCKITTSDNSNQIIKFLKQ